MSDSGPDFSRLGYNSVEELEEDLGIGQTVLTADKPEIITPNQSNIQIDVPADKLTAGNNAYKVEFPADADSLTDLKNQSGQDAFETLLAGSKTYMEQYGDLLQARLEEINLETGGSFEIDTDGLTDDAEAELDSAATSPWTEIFNTGAAMKADNPNIDILAETLAKSGNDSVQTVRTDTADTEDEEKKKRDRMRLFLAENLSGVENCQQLINQMGEHYDNAMDFYEQAAKHREEAEELTTRAEELGVALSANRAEISERLQRHQQVSEDLGAAVTARSEAINEIRNEARTKLTESDLSDEMRVNLQNVVARAGERPGYCPS